jgi:hypothetical protein
LLLLNLIAEMNAKLQELREESDDGTSPPE